MTGTLTSAMTTTFMTALRVSHADLIENSCLRPFAALSRLKSGLSRLLETAIPTCARFPATLKIMIPSVIGKIRMIAVFIPSMRMLIATCWSGFAATLIASR